MSYITVLSKRDKNIEYPPNLLIVDVDRTNPILGNPYVMKDKNSESERQKVISDFRTYFNEQMNKDSLVRRSVLDLVSMHKSGRPIGLRCWCAPNACHADVIKEAIESLAGNNTMTQEVQVLAGNLSTADKIEVKEIVKVVTDPNTKEARRAAFVKKYLERPWPESEIDYVECRFVVFVPDFAKKGTDWHMVKEIVHLKNGEVHPNVRFIPNYEATAYVTQAMHRKTYSQKKEWEELSKVVTIKAPNHQMSLRIAQALGRWELATRPDLIKDSPYVFGLDVPSQVDLKHQMRKAMGSKKETPYSIAYSDTETDMLGRFHPTIKLIIMQSIFYKGELYTYVAKDFVKGIYDPEKYLKEAWDTYMPDQGKGIVKKWHFEFVDRPINCVKEIIKKAHELSPDFLSFWNMIFDWDTMCNVIIQDALEANPALEKHEYERVIAETFCDPKLPWTMKYYHLKRANPSKTSASGRQMSKKPADQWHTVTMPTPFYLICQMATYRFVRKSKQIDKEGTSLDFILNKELPGLSKLKFKQAEGLEKAEFHIFLQEHHPLEYIIYHCWDAVCMELLTEKTKDLSFAMPGTTGISDFMSYESEPKRYVHDFHYFALDKHECVTGITGKTLTQEWDSMTISTKGHIITLEPHLTVAKGMQVFKDYPELKTYVYSHAGDLDVKGSYPYGQWVFNMSRATTVRELIEIHGVRDHVRRIQGLNLSGGASNALEFCSEIFDMTTLANLSKIYLEEKAKGNV